MFRVHRLSSRVGVKVAGDTGLALRQWLGLVGHWKKRTVRGCVDRVNFTFEKHIVRDCVVSVNFTFDKLSVRGCVVSVNFTFEELIVRGCVV